MSNINQKFQDVEHKLVVQPVSSSYEIVTIFHETSLIEFTS